MSAKRPKLGPVTLRWVATHHEASAKRAQTTVAGGRYAEYHGSLVTENASWAKRLHNLAARVEKGR